MALASPSSAPPLASASCSEHRPHTAPCPSHSSPMPTSMTTRTRSAQSLFPGRYFPAYDLHLGLSSSSRLRFTGISACGAHNVRGTHTDQESGQTPTREDRVVVTLGRPDVRAAVPSLAQEAARSGRATMHTSDDRGCSVWSVSSLGPSSSLFDSSLDHEERIALFARTSESDPELPFGPFLRCVFAVMDALCLCLIPYIEC